MDNYEFKNAIPKDLEKIIPLLSKYNLPTTDLDQNDMHNFLICTSENEIIGTIGLERYGEFALLRSLCVEEIHRNYGIGSILVNNIFKSLNSLALSSIYLLTTTADNFFFKFGFQKIDRSNAPPLIQQSRQFVNLCPSSAIFMRKNL